MRMFSLDELRFAFAMFLTITVFYVFIVLIMDAFVLSFYTRLVLSFGVIYIGSTIFYIAYRFVEDKSGE